MNEQELMVPVEAFEPAMMNDPVFRELFAALATVYAVSVLKVKEVHDGKRAFESAKQRLTTFVARSSGWQVRAGFIAKVPRATRDGNGSGNRVHEADVQEGQVRQSDPGDVAGLGRRSGGIRCGQLAAAVAGQPACPTCGSPGTRYWRQKGVVVCPKCFTKGTK